MFQLGLDHLLSDHSLLNSLKGRRVALVAHPASVNSELHHSLDLLIQRAGLNITAAFGPQHGMRGEKQDNMIESDDYRDPKFNIPVFSLYGRVRRPTSDMLETFDILLFDLQDVGCRIYTYLTTLVYLLEDLNGTDKEIWVLDRPNPVGRPLEGNHLEESFFSFVGAVTTPIRHGLTLGEMGQWYRWKKGLRTPYKVVTMRGYDPTKPPGFGWPVGELAWVNPSPNLPRLSGTRSFPGTVLLEGTTLSEGRGTTTPLEIMGAPDIEGEKILRQMQNQAPHWLSGAILRPCYFEPCFQKHAGSLCSGLQIHTDQKGYSHSTFRPYRLVSIFLKSLRQLYPDYPLWRNPPYEYEDKLMPVDMLSGNDKLRHWVDDPSATVDDWESYLRIDENLWLEERREFFLY